MVRLCFLIRSLNPGGAERQLVELVKRLDPSRFQVTVLTFYPGGLLEQDLAGTSVELISLRKQGRWDVAGFVARARAAVAARQPDIVHGYLGVANELALLVGRLCRARVVWGIRSSHLDLSQYDWSYAATFRGGAVLSRFVDLVIYNSAAGMRHYGAHGYRPRRAAVIPNGIDVSRFRFDADGRQRLRREWGIDPGERLVALVGRADPMKDTSLFLAAAQRLRAAGPWRFVCVGDTSTDYGRRLQASAAARELGPSLVWAGTRADMPAVYSAIDTLVVASRFGEGLPNVLVEAMACEVPCVTTDVGDASAVVGSTGWVVPARDAAAIVAACRAAAAESESSRSIRGRAARQRVVDQFSAEQLVNRTSTILSEIAR